MFGGWHFYFDDMFSHYDDDYYSSATALPCASRITLNVETRQMMPEKTVFFDDGTTMMIINGQRYEIRAQNEEFDEEKAVLMCLAKANGYTYGDISRAVKKAIHTKKKKEK